MKVVYALLFTLVVIFNFIELGTQSRISEYRMPGSRDTSNVVHLSSSREDEPMDLLIRKKRVVDETQSGGLSSSLGRFPYIVNILKNGISHCAGIIMEPDIILTVNTCIMPPISNRFSILSGSSERDNGTTHNIIRNRVFSSRSSSVMFKIYPPIQFRQSHGNKGIELFTELLPPLANAWFGGWGCIKRGPKIRTVYPKRLKMTHLPLISHQECSQRHGHNINEPRYICTLDTSKRRATCMGDEGGPLVFRGHLVGVLLYPTSEIGRYPDVFVNLLEHNEHQWFISSRNSLMAQ